MKIEELKEKGILEVLKNFKVYDFVVYANRYIGENLEIGEQYNFHYQDSIHYTIKKNIEKGLHDLFSNYKIDYADMFDLFKVNTWNISISVEYNGISCWKNIGRYDFDKKTRKNASVNNSKFNLMGLPIFKLDDDLRNYVVSYDYISYDIGSLTMYEFIIGLLEGERQKMISKYQADILGCKRKIAEDRSKIEDLENIVF